ncbi:CD1375 family protein [Peribacillus simplex]
MGVLDVAKIYYDLIKLKLRKIENVPLDWRTSHAEFVG